MRDAPRAATKFDAALGARIRARRLDLDMSQERLAERLGLTFQQVQKYERGINRIAAERLVDIAHALELPIFELVDGLKPKPGVRGRRT